MKVSDLLLTAPGWLWLLPLPMLIALWRHLAGRISPLPPPAPRRALFHPRAIRATATVPPTGILRLREGIWWVALLLLVVALAGPARPRAESTRPSPAPELLFLIDTSVAMALRDYRIEGRPVERMEVLRDRLHRFVEEVEGGRVGLVVFGEEAHTLVPPTRDTALLHRMIQRIPTTLAGRESALGDAVLLGLKLAARRQPRPALVLFSAAPPPPGGIPPMAAAEVARSLGIPLHTVALGDGEGERGGPAARLVHQPPDTRLLEAMAELTGGGHWQVGDGQALAVTLATIAEGDRALRPVDRRIPPHQSLYAWPLALALLLLAVAEAIPATHRRRSSGR
ncbi:MAG TPA: VWA domain-containing protein [Thiotrichales bacterium]|nr:VWA domain-containing protein [Thiotrichales bacterium]